MSVSVKVGTFTQKATTGTQAVAGLGFQPKALIVWTAGSSAASGTWQASYAAGIGFTAGASNSGCVASGSTNGVATSATQHRTAAQVISLVNGAGTLVCEAALSSFDSGGFTLNFTTTDGTARVFCYMAIGGADVTGAQVLNWVTPTTAGGYTVTGTTFQPDLVFTATSMDTSSPPVTGTTSRLSLGFMNAAGQQASAAIEASNAVNPSAAFRAQRTDAGSLSVDSSSGGSIWDMMQFEAMCQNGFTVNVAGVINNPGLQMISLCLQGVSSRIGVISAVSGTASSVSHVGFTPRGIFFATQTGIPAATATTTVYQVCGATDTTTSNFCAVTDHNAVSPTVAYSNWGAGCYINLSGANPPTTTTTVTFTSTNSDGFTVSAYDFTGGEIIYCAIGDANTNTFPRTLP